MGSGFFSILPGLAESFSQVSTGRFRDLRSHVAPLASAISGAFFGVKPFTMGGKDLHRSRWIAGSLKFDGFNKRAIK